MSELFEDWLVNEYGPHPAGLAAYRCDRARRIAGHERDPCANPVHRWPGKAGLSIDSFSFTTGDRLAEIITTGDTLDIVVTLKSDPGVDFACFYYVTFWTDDGHRAMRIESPIDYFKGDRKLRSVWSHIDRFPLGAGRYSISISVYDELVLRSAIKDPSTRYDTLHRCCRIKVIDPNTTCRALSYPAGRWEFPR